MDYARFHERNPYLAAKLLTVFVEHPVVFLGYSLGDPNITDIIRSVAACLTTETLPKLRDRLIFVQWDESATGVDVGNGSIVASSYSIPVVTVRVGSMMPIFETLSSLKRKFPARVLRQLKQHVYELVLTDDPKERLYVRDIDAADPAALDVVFGVGAIAQLREKGYVGITREEIIRDTVFDDQNYNPGMLVTETLPKTLRIGGTYAPVFKYLRAAAEQDSTILSRLDSRVAVASKRRQEVFYPPKSYRKKSQQFANKATTFAELVAQCSAVDVLNHASMLDPSKINLDDLTDFLRKNFDLLHSDSSLTRTQFIKLVCLFDLLKYGPTPAEKAKAAKSTAT